MPRKHMITVYARKEPSKDGSRGRSDVQIYRDAACTTPFARFSWWCSNKPDRRFKRVTLNCYRWLIHWLPAAETNPSPSV